MTVSDDLVLYDAADGVVTLTLNRPARKNAWTIPLEHRYFERLDEAAKDPDVRAIVVTGAGRSFCPGLDMDALGRAAKAGAVKRDDRRPQSYPRGIPKPMIAAVNGACAGIGLIQALLCDVRFVARGARLTTAYVRRGLPAEYGTSWLLPRLIGLERALDLLLSGRVVEADEALTLGLCSRVCEPDELLPAAIAYARDLAENCSPRAMAAMRQQVYGDQHRSFEEAMDEALAVMAQFAALPDIGEGVASFIERRPPQFESVTPDFSVRSTRDAG